MTFKIGMKLSEVLNTVKTGNSSANDKTKELIFNFCKNDDDQVISNGNELAILNAWASGSEKVPMPKPKGKEANAFGKQFIYDVDKENNLFTDYGEGTVMTGSKDVHNYKTDTLLDTDGDGYADQRLIHDGSALAGNQKLIMADSNLNGIPDDKE